MTDTLATVVELRRHPVKSLGPELLARADVDARGVAGDRAYGVFDRSTGHLLSAKRLPQMLAASARFVDGVVADDALEITLPDGAVLRGVHGGVHDALSAWLGRSVELRRGLPSDPPRSIEIEIDLDDPTRVFEFHTQPGLLFDGAVLHLLSIQSLATARSLYPEGVWSADRFRPNLVIDLPSAASAPWPEDAWVGHVLEVGTARIDIRKRCDRCVLTTRAVGDAPPDKQILRTLAAHHGADLGLKAMVTGAGTVTVGDTVAAIG